MHWLFPAYFVSFQSNYSMEKKKWWKYFTCIGGVCLFISLSFRRYFPFGPWAGLIIFGATMTVGSLFMLGIYFNTYMDECKKTAEKNGRHIEPLFRERGMDEGIGWTFNIKNPYAAPLLILLFGIIPGIGLSVLNDSIYPLLVIALLVALPFIIRKFRKP